jgi:hypothetical protein
MDTVAAIHDTGPGHAETRVETYGDHQEAAAAALNRLITEDLIPAEPSQANHLLHCREVVIDALHQRLYALGLNTHHPVTAVPVRTDKLHVRELEKNLPTLLDRIAFEVPRLPVDERRSPAQVLGQPSRDATVELWRHAAIDLLAGSHALDTAAERPWLTDPGGGWYLMRDVAIAIEAFLVLDSRLDEVGLLNEHDRPKTTYGLEERRMMASQCARVATWHATSASPDLATPEPAADRALLGPVQTITKPAELAAAQRRLAAYLKPTHRNDLFYDGRPEMDATTARMVIASQVFLTRQFERIANEIPETESIGAEFACRREILETIQSSMAHLIDAENRGRSQRAAWQQGELTTAVRRMQRNGVDMRMSSTQLLDLANATHEVTHNVGKALRRELLRDTSNLRLADPTTDVGPTRVPRRHPRERSMTDLINVPAPSEPVARHVSPLQRAALRATLEVTPTSRRTPSPYPQARVDTPTGYPR